MATREQEILQEVQQAYKNREIKPFFQPLYDALTQKIVGAEALARWFKPDGSLVMPGTYIPILEESDAILDLDWYMIKEVCSSMREQKKKGIPCVKISVNFSRNHISDVHFVEKLCSIADQYEIEHHMLQVEITESALGHDTEQVDHFISAIRKEGFMVAIDDFGNGLSSLSMVKDVSVDTLKIDRSLVSRNCEDEKERIVLESIVNFAHRLKLVTVAEGVETEEQLGFLRTCGCNVIQGFLFARPMPKQDFWKLCIEDAREEMAEDILAIQPFNTAEQMLLDVIYEKYPMIIYINVTRNSYYMMTYENYTSKSCAASGTFDECIGHAASTLHPDDREIFIKTFCVENQLAVYNRGERCLKLITRQKGDDGVYRRVETSNYFVKNDSVKDVLVISLNQNLDD